MQLRPGMILHRTFLVRNTAGIHARAAAQIVQLATKHDGAVIVVSGDQSGDGKSIMELMLLAAGPGVEVRFELGPPEESARQILDELECMFAGGFGERRTDP